MSARAAVRRTDVLSHAARLFARDGYRATSLALVGANLDVTRQALYYLFKSKDEILGALFEQLMTRLELSMLEVLSDQEIESESRFEYLVRAHVEVTLDNADLVVVLMRERPELERLEWLHAEERRRDYARLFIDAFESGVASGALRPANAWISVNALIAAVNGVCLLAHGEGDRLPASTNVVELLQDLLGAGILDDPALRPATAGSARAGVVAAVGL